MPKFVYKAKDGPTKAIEGELLAESEAAALAKIDGMGYVPVWVREKGLEGATEGHGLGFSKVRQRDITVFTRQLAGLIKSGVNILRALRTVREQCANRRFQRTVAKIEDRVRDGRMLSEALAGHPRIFPELYVNMVRSGESAGLLDTVLLRLAEAREKEEEVRRQVQSALAYPALVLAVGAATVLVMLVFFLPRIMGLYSNFGQLPLPTRILKHMSDACREYWLWALIPMVLLALITRRMTSGGAGRMLVDQFKLRMPLVGSLIREAEIARFCRTMSLLIAAGVPIDRSLSLSAGTLNNKVLKAEVEEVKKLTVQQGMSIAAGLARTRNFPVFVRNMVAVGEEGGNLDESLGDVATFYEREVEGHIRLMTSLIEPLFILVVGGVVGFIVFAMLLPIFDITKTIR